MEPNDKWINDWMFGEDPSKEKLLGKDFLEIFTKFWEKTDLDNKLKSAKNRYTSALHAI